MEENVPPLSVIETASVLSGAALRELQQRAQSALSASRAQAARLEADITRQLDDLAATLSDQLAADAESAAQAEQHEAEVARLAAEFESSRQEWQHERETLNAQVERLSNERKNATLQVEEQQAEIARLTSALEKSGDVSLAERNTLTAEVERLKTDCKDFAFQAEHHQAEITRLSAELEASREAWRQERETLTTEVEKLSSDLKQTDEGRLAECESLTSEVARLTNELETSRANWRKAHDSLERQRDELSKQVEDSESKHQATQVDWRDQLLGFEARLREQQNAWNEQRTEWTAARTVLERERDELQNKFELALEDVQRLRERAAEMEHDLARRPEVAQADSMELVALRTERDALVAKVEQLAHQPAAQIDPDVEQQLSDLQRRFEMAVEDVRELKTKNAKLERQLATAAASGSPSVPCVDSGAMDWESQKRRMLASLEDGEDSSDPEVVKERATIAGTIEMTDAVVAEKDRQIASLETELEVARADPVMSDDDRNLHFNELMNADEVIVECRKRSQQYEREMEEKLRAAELELSVERAKIARQRAELEELRNNLESQRQLYESTGVVPAPGAPRRRWLSKLGIDGKDKE